MEADAPEGTLSQGGKGRGAKPRKPKGAKRPTGKRSLNLSLPIEDYKRLALHALDEETTISVVVSRLVREHLHGLHLTRTGSRAAEQDAA